MPRVVVVGAGAAGTMAAIFAASDGRRDAARRAHERRRPQNSDQRRRPLQHPARAASTNRASSPIRRRISLRRIVRSWPLREQIAFFERELALPLVEETGIGQAVSEIAKRARRARHAARLRAAQGRERRHRHARHRDSAVRRPVDRRATRGQNRSTADAVILATGGLSVPNTGSDGRGLGDRRSSLVTSMNPTYAALTPLTATRGRMFSRFSRKTHPTPFRELAGISLPVTITARSRRRARRATHRRISVHAPGLQRAVRPRRVARRGAIARGGRRTGARSRCSGRRLSDGDWEAALRPRGTRTVLAAVGAELPHRLAEALVAAAMSIRPCRSRNSAEPSALRLIDTLVRGPLPWTGDEGYKKAEVTGGGVGLAEIDPAHDGKPPAQGTVSLRRDARCLRPDRRLQLSVGVGDRTCRRPRARARLR